MTARIRLWTGLITLLVLAAMTLEIAAALERVESGAAPASVQQEGDASLPCGPKWRRSYEPMAVAQGDTVKVTVWYDFDCNKEQDLANVMLVVNNSIPNDFNDRQGLERNLRSGLQEFVGRFDLEGGSSLGLSFFNDSALVRSPLRNGAGHRGALILEIESFRVALGTAIGMADAIFDAYKQLPTQDAEQSDRNWMIVFDAGAQPGSPEDRCVIAARAGVKIIGIQLPAARGRLAAGCINSGLYTASDNSGSDLSNLFNQAAQHIVRGSTIESTIVNEYYRSDLVDYVEGSESHPYSGHFGDTVDWVFDATSHPRGGAGQSLSYELRIKEDEPIAPDIIKISEDHPEIMFRFASGPGFQHRDLENPEICVYRPGREMQDCGHFLITPAPPPTSTATVTATTNPLDTATPKATIELASPTPTQTLQAPTPTIVPSQTVEPCSDCIYLPISKRQS